MKKYLIPAIIISIIVVLIATGIVFYSVDKNHNNWKPVETVKIKESFTVSGNVESLNESHIRAPLTGIIESIMVQEGDEVKKDQLIAVYDKSEYMGRLKSVEANLFIAEQTYNKMQFGYRKQEIQNSEANLKYNKLLLKEKKLAYEKLKTDLPRNTSLYEKKMLTPKEYEDFTKDLEIALVEYENQKNKLESAYNEYDLLKEGYRIEDRLSAKGSVDEIKGTIEELKSVLKKTEIKSPVEGKITDKSVFEGESVITGNSLFKIFNKSKLEIKANIEEEDIANISTGDKVKIIPDAYPTKTLTGKVKSIYNKVDTSSRLLPVRINVIENPDNIQLMAGMTVSCNFEGHKRLYNVVPKEALQREGRKFYLITKHGKVYVQAGKEHDNRVIVKGKIEPGEQVLVK
jgi:multidrug resistance efflux pump